MDKFKSSLKRFRPNLKIRQLVVRDKQKSETQKETRIFAEAQAQIQDTSEQQEPEQQERYNIGDVVVDEREKHLGGNIVGGDSETFYPDLWKWLVCRFTVKSILDVGCGEGDALEVFEALGCKVLGIDGLERNIKKCRGKAIRHDLCEAPFRMKNLDLIWCCEVVEHIPESALSNLLITLTQGSFLAMTHAVPGQPGYHHVNCQISKYWKEKLSNFSYEFLREDTYKSKQYAHGHWQRTGMIFARSQII